VSNKQELQAAVTSAEAALTTAKANLAAFEALAENNRFETLEKALSAVEGKLYSQASADCEGSHNCGQDSYTQEFMVGETRYRGTLTLEYNRHDKTYYYIESDEFTYETIS